MSECFTSKPNANGTFWNAHIKINWKINIFETNKPCRRGVVGRVSAYQPSGQVTIAREVRNFHFTLGDVCPLRMSWFVLSLAVALALCWPHIQGGPPLWFHLVFWSIVCFSPYIGEGKQQMKKETNKLIKLKVCKPSIFKAQNMHC